MALDPATVTGFAIGRAGTSPRSGSVRLKRTGDEPGVAAFNMLAFLRDTFTLEKPDLVAAEHWISPSAMKGQDAMILQLMVHGVIAAVCRAYSVRLETPAINSIRLHYCGRASAGGRDETKRMVLARAKALGQVPHGCTDLDRADAVALWDMACATYARAQPTSLVLFGETARG